MKHCFQSQGQSILDHGISVHNYFIDLKNHVLNNSNLEEEWKVPDWAFDLNLWSKILSDSDIKNYQIYHDCGKPFCIEYDNEQRKHFPNHAFISSKIWSQISDNSTIENLIRKDMEVHTLKADECDDFCLDINTAATLLLTGLAELHSNAAMFGGIDSTSFKIKWKHLNKRGKKITNIIQKTENKND